ncbi:hypothetical protein BH23ACT9_BH23ACT9_14500 [soil metagenome]
MRYRNLTEHRPGAGGAGPVWAGEEPARYDVDGGGLHPGVLEGVEQALQGLSVINDWLTAVADMPAGVIEPDVIQGLLVGLGHIDAATLAGICRTVVIAEETGCADRDGQASPAAWVAQQLRQSAVAAARTCRLAADMDTAPDVLAALEAGRIGRDHAIGLAAAGRQQRADQQAAERARRQAESDAIAAQRRQAEAEAAALADTQAREARLDAAEAAERAAREAAAVESARRRAAAEEAHRARQADLLARAKAGASPNQVIDDAATRRASDPDALLRAEAVQRANRYLKTWTDETDGSGRGSWSLPAATHDMLRELLDAARTHDEPDCEPDERRSFQQRQADAFTDIITLAARTGELPTSRGQKPHMSAIVPLTTLAGDSDQPGRTRYGTRLSPQAARRIACDAALTRIVLNATSMVLDVGRETRQWTSAQYKAAETTFGGCAFPVREGEMCGRPPGWCDLHHVDHWEHGGSTDQDKGVLLCCQHHDAVHHNGWTLLYDHTGQTITVTRPRPDGSLLQRTVTLARAHPASVSPAEADAESTMAGRAEHTVAEPADGRLPL